jgi:hypothetical protein
VPSKIAKLVQLFESGKMVRIALPGGDSLKVWVQKLSPFHAEAAIHEGRVARARRMMAIREVGSDEYTVFASQVEASNKAALVAGLLTVKGDETLAKVLRDIRTEVDWVERVEVIEHSAEQLELLASDSIEIQQYSKMLDEYQSEIMKRVEEENKAYKRELEDMQEDDLRDRFREHYVESQGMNAFSETRQRYEIFYAARQCAGIAKDGHWNHDHCDHTIPLLDSVNDLAEIPAEVGMLIQATLMELTVPPDLARFMEGPASSSESHGPSSTPEGSAASSPEASSTPAKTS